MRVADFHINFRVGGHTRNIWSLTMKIEKYGVSKRQEYAKEKLIRLDDGAIPGVERILLLPIPSTRDGLHLTGTETLMSDILMDVELGDAVIGYAIPREDIEIIEASGAMCIDLSSDEEFLAENARLTALGAVGYILTEFPQAVDEMPFGIVGYGRIGERLVAYLTALGADVTVYTSKKATRVELGGYGIKTEAYERDEGELDIPHDMRVLINTAPTSLKRSFPGGVTPDGLSVIELASGKNFDGVSGVIRLPSLPEIMYPKSASEAYYRAILRGVGASI